MYCYRKGLLNYENGVVSLKVLGCIAIISAYFMLLRGKVELRGVSLEKIEDSF